MADDDAAADTMEIQADADADGDGAPRPRILEVPLQSSEILEIVLDDLTEEPDQIRYMADMFALEKVPVETWTKTLDEFARRGSYDTATSLGEAGVTAFKRVGDAQSTVPLLCMMASYAIIQARSAPKQPLPRPRQYTVKDKPKAHYFARATQLVTQAEQIDARNGFVLDTKANLFLLTSKYDEASRIYDFILTQTPGHLFALMGKARIQYMRQQFRASLKLYQNVLSAAPDFLPDPRIGIGLCFWNLGEFAIARRAWERSRVVNPGKHSTGASLLLGLSYINEARQASSRLTEDDRVEIYSTGINYVQDAWKHDKTCASTAAALSGYFLTASGKWDTVIKLAELAVQHGEAKAVISEGQLAIARALHAQGKYEDAARHYQQSLDMNKDQLVASMGLAQMSIIKKEYITAVGSFDQIVRSHPKCLEALAVMAAIHSRQALSIPIATSATSVSEIAQAKEAARETYDIAVRLFQGTPDGARDSSYLDAVGPRVQQIARDPDLYVEIGRLWTGEDLNKSLNAYRQALQVRQEREEEEAARHSQLTNGELAQATSSLNATSRIPQLLSNIGALEFARGDLASAQERFEQAVTLEAEKQQTLSENGASITAAASAEADAVMMTLMYNLGIVMEARGQRDTAADLYENRLLARHPEFLDAKARLAAIALQEKQYDRCQEFLKSALIAQPGHLDIRALYTYFNIEVNNLQAAKEFAVLTLKDQNRSDTYAMCAMAYLLYQQAREMRGTKNEDIKERLSRFYRANEAFDKVLQYDPGCAYAAQGIAIALAENNLGAKPTGNTATLASSEAAQRQKNLRDALTILAKVREVTNDANVYVNIALCHFQREEFERAIENLETANNRFYRNKHLPTLLYLARARFHKAARDQSFSVLQDALASAEAAQLLAPKDESIKFNIALIQQRGLETLQELQPAGRRLAEIHTAIKNAEIAQKSFRDLAETKAPSVTYSIEMADQRSRFIETMLRRAPATLREQEEWEQSEANKVEIARLDRDAERAKQAEVERVKREETRRQAEELATARRQMVEDARTWYVKPVAVSDDDEDKPKRGKGRKKKEMDGIVPDGDGEEVVKQPKKRKKADGAAAGGKRKKKAKGENGQAAVGGDDNAEAGSAEASGAEKDDEDEGPKRAGGRRKKAFRTKELISDSENSN